MRYRKIRYRNSISKNHFRKKITFQVEKEQGIASNNSMCTVNAIYYLQLYNIINCIIGIVEKVTLIAFCP